MGCRTKRAGPSRERARLVARLYDWEALFSPDPLGRETKRAVDRLGWSATVMAVPASLDSENSRRL